MAMEADLQILPQVILTPTWVMEEGKKTRFIWNLYGNYWLQARNYFHVAGTRTNTRPQKSPGSSVPLSLSQCRRRGHEGSKMIYSGNIGYGALAWRGFLLSAARQDAFSAEDVLAIERERGGGVRCS